MALADPLVPEALVDLVPVGLLDQVVGRLALGDEFVYLRDSGDEAFFHSKVKGTLQFFW